MSAGATLVAAQRRPVAHGRVRGSSLPLLVGAVIVALATAYALASLRSHADGRREAQVLVATMQTSVQEHTAWVWRAVVEGATEDIVTRTTALRTEIGANLDRLGLVDPGGQLLVALLRAVGDYEIAATRVLTTLALRQPTVLASDIADVRRTSEVLAAMIGDVDAAYRSSVTATTTAANVGTTTTLVSSAVLLALLFRRSERSRRTAAVLAHEQRILRESEERFRALVQRSSDMTTVIDPVGRVRYQSPSVERILGRGVGDVTGANWRGLIHPDDTARMGELLDAVADGSEPTETIEWRVRHADGRWLELETTVTNLLDEPNVAGIVLNSRDVTDRSDLQRRLYHQAFHDTLTGLPNRARFMEHLSDALARAHRRGTQVAILLLDLDLFKTVNDSLGHAAGDELLIGVAERIRAALRSQDMAARLAGDEFAVCVEDVAGPADAARVAERIAEALRRPFTVHGRQVFTAASVGIVCASESAVAEDLLRDADVAMYRAKVAGERGYAVFEPSMHTAAVERLQSELDLREAIGTADMALAYQPVCRLDDGEVVAVEALARWHHPRLGDVAPGRFIPLAEEAGLIGQLGWWVLETAVAQLRDWRSSAARRDLVMNVNLSVRQLHDPELVGRLTALLARMHVPTSALVLELTEGAFRSPDGTAVDVLAQLRGHGIRIAIDDFGTGYSTLGRLQSLPVDMVKIDRSFVAQLGVLGDPAVVRAMVDLSHALRLITVAEGVETEAQRSQLRDLGCDQAQGYLLGAPVSAAELWATALRTRGG